MRSTISVASASDATFSVTVDDGTSRTVHHVTVTPEDIARYAPGTAAARLVKASFQFLLEREPKEAILRKFDLPVIEQYFPEYPARIREML